MELAKAEAVQVQVQVHGGNGDSPSHSALAGSCICYYPQTIPSARSSAPIVSGALKKKVVEIDVYYRISAR
jgi:hypothetical protein